MTNALRLILLYIGIAMAVSSCSGTGSYNREIDGAPERALSFSMSISSSSNQYAERLKDINDVKWIKELEKLTKTDLKIRMFPLKDFHERMSLMFASNDIPDVVQNIGGATTTGMSGSVEAGIFMPLDELLKEHAPNIMREVPEEAWAETSYNGQIYGIPSWLSIPSRRATYIRSDLLKRTGLPAPETVEEFLDVLRAMKRLGVEYPYQMRENFKYADTILGAFDVLPSQFEIVDGEVVPKFFDVEHMTAALQTYKTMLDEELIPKDFATITQGEYSKRIESGQAGIWSANAKTLSDSRNKISMAVPEAEVDIIPSPRGPEQWGGYLLYPNVASSYYINRKISADKAADIVRFFDWMLTPEAETYFSFGIENDTYRYEDGEIRFTIPETDEEIDLDSFRTGLWFVHDGIYMKQREQLTENGRDMLFAMNNVVSREGLGTVRFFPALNSFAKYPDLVPQSDDVGPKLIIDHMIRMIYGAEPISDWPKVIEEYKAKGGNDILEEATRRYRENNGVSVTENLK
jgi:putative aldouronate transport system substrate-binding protein